MKKWPKTQLFTTKESNTRSNEHLRKRKERGLLMNLNGELDADTKRDGVWTRNSSADSVRNVLQAKDQAIVVNGGGQRVATT